jgi:hypothetical protein
MDILNSQIFTGEPLCRTPSTSKKHFFNPVYTGNSSNTPRERKHFLKQFKDSVQLSGFESPNRKRERYRAKTTKAKDSKTIKFDPVEKIEKISPQRSQSPFQNMFKYFLK